MPPASPTFPTLVTEWTWKARATTTRSAVRRPAHGTSSRETWGAESIWPARSRYNLIQGNLIGTDATGSKPIANSGDGVELDLTDFEHDRRDRGRCPKRHLGKHGSGIRFTLNAIGNVILGNFIGTDHSGLRPLPNEGDGVDLGRGLRETIGGTVAGAEKHHLGKLGERDQYSASGAADNLIVGNFIGTDVYGTERPPQLQRRRGPHGETNDTIGGTSCRCRKRHRGEPGKRNPFSARTRSGNQVDGNFIGTDAAGLSVRVQRSAMAWTSRGER